MEKNFSEKSPKFHRKAPLTDFLLSIFTGQSPSFFNARQEPLLRHFLRIFINIGITSSLSTKSDTVHVIR